PGVSAWWNSVSEDDLWLSALVLGEIRKGLELVRDRDEFKAEALEKWLDEVISSFGDRVIPIDTAIAEEWGRMTAIRSVSVIDTLLAATAKVHGLTFVTRNVADVAELNVDVLNPFDA
ncbi:MAG: type II toxin-antitoxin system VapC family toxin, partial [Pseudomonadales bacterium]|nr:type II toxin-antitoxin system VapC family toxin [Pseudomonadales bacterium]